MILELKGLKKTLGGQPVLKGISLDVRAGEFLTLLGPSGCGKTTTLRIVAGFETPDAGTVVLDGRDVTSVPPYRRDVHTVFQHYALFPHFDVFENVAFGLRLRGLGEDEIRRKVLESLEIVQLAGFERRSPEQLSGGQKQRVALARALVGQPKVLLLDEPLGALDLKLRKEMQLELKRIHRKLGLTFIYVTHDQEEAMTMSDRIVVMNHGVLEQLGTPRDIYERPASRFVADFIGASNLLEARLVKANGKSAELLLEGELRVTVPLKEGASLREGASLMVAIRPEKVEVLPAEAASEQSGRKVRVPCELKESVFLGSTSRLYLSAFKNSPKLIEAVTVRETAGNGHGGPKKVVAEFLSDDIHLFQ